MTKQRTENIIKFISKRKRNTKGTYDWIKPFISAFYFLIRIGILLCECTNYKLETAENPISKIEGHNRKVHPVNRKIQGHNHKVQPFNRKLSPL